MKRKNKIKEFFELNKYKIVLSLVLLILSGIHRQGPDLSTIRGLKRENELLRGDKYEF